MSAGKKAPLLTEQGTQTGVPRTHHPPRLPRAPCPEQTLGKRKQCQVETSDI